jgi:hypothetical protein
MRPVRRSRVEKKESDELQWIGFRPGDIIPDVPGAAFLLVGQIRDAPRECET